MFQPLLATFREPFIYYKNIKLLCYNIISICPGLLTIKIVTESSSKSVEKFFKFGPICVYCC
jgi:hypothetical protein